MPIPTAAFSPPLAIASASGARGGTRCVHLTTPAGAGASGLVPEKTGRSLLSSLTRALPGHADRTRCVHLTTPRQRERSRACRSRTLRSPDNSRHRGRTRAYCHQPIAFPFLLANERSRACRSRTLRSPDNSRHRGRTRAYCHQPVAFPLLLANASAPGLADRARCVHLTTPATAGAPGSCSHQTLHSLPPRQRERPRGPQLAQVAFTQQPPATAGAPGPSAQPSCLPLHRMLDTAPQESRRRSLSEPSLPNVPVFNPQALQSHAGAAVKDNRSHGRRAHGCVR
jgi:hypothetical protein